MMGRQHVLAVLAVVALSLCWPLFGCKSEKASGAGAGEEGSARSGAECPRPKVTSGTIEDTAVSDCEAAVCKKTGGKLAFQPRTRGPRPMTRLEIENRYWSKDPNIKAFTVTGMIMVSGYYTGKEVSRVYACNWKDGNAEIVSIQ
jgi:hypothetical protein